MNILEEKIKRNKNSFDAHEPSGDHFEKFEKKLDRLHDKPSVHFRASSQLMKIAAVLLVVLVLSVTMVYIFNYGAGGINGQVAETALPEDVQLAKNYYGSLTDAKLEKIAQCASDNEEAARLKEMATNEIAELDKESEKLQEDLAKDSNNKRLSNALVMNYKRKSKIIESILNRICKY